MINWNRRFMAVAELVASWSKDRSRQCGCVVVGPDREIRSTGYNGFPRGVNDDEEDRHHRPVKYLWTEHAERNAVYNAARMGLSLKDCTIYVSWYPCADCARAIIQSGIRTVVCKEPDWDDQIWKADFAVTKVMLAEGGATTTFLLP